MRKYSYANEKANLALRSMALGNSTLRERIGNAYMFHLMHVDPKYHTGDGDLPPSTYDDFNQISKQLDSKKAVADEGNIVASLNAMNDDEIYKLANRFVDLLEKIQDIYAHPEDYQEE